MSSKGLLLFCCLVLTVSVFPQQKTRGPRKYQAIVRPDETKPFDPMPRIEGFALFVAIDTEGKTRVSVRTSETSSEVTVVDLVKIYGQITTPPVFPGPEIKFADPIIILSAEPSVTYGTIEKVVDPLRKPGKNRIKLEAGNGRYIVVPAKNPSAQEIKPKPNPLTLVVRVDKELNVSLNNEPQGSLDDLSALTMRLADIFKRRAENGVFREGTSEIETTIFLRLPENIKFEQIRDLDTALRNVGSDLIGLAIGW